MLDWLEEGKISFDADLRILKQKHPNTDFEKYFGQVNAEGLKHGFGRECWISG